MRNGKRLIDMELINLDKVQSVLEEYGRDVRNAFQDNLIKGDRISSGKLLNSVEYSVEFNGVSYLVKLSLEDYWKYLEEGVRGKDNPSSPFANPGWKAYPFILDWITVKPVVPRPNKDGKLPTPRQLAGAITYSIVEKGTQPTNDLEKAIEQVNGLYKDKLVYALRDDMDRVLKLIVGDIQGEMPEVRL